MRNLSLLSGLFIVAGISAIVVGAPPASAQLSCTKNTSSSWNGFQWAPPLAAGAYGCDPTATQSGTIVCTLNTNDCAPPAASGENSNPNSCGGSGDGPGHGGLGGGGGSGSGGSGSGAPTAGGPDVGSCGSPINLATGDVYINQTDLSIPGLGGGLRLTRSWNSLWPHTQSGFRTGMFGPNWRSNFEEKIFIGTDNYIKYLRSDGNFWSFGYNNSNWLPAAPANATAVLTQNSTNWILTFKNGEQELFDINTGVLTSIVDRNGNATVLTYDGLNRLATVTDSASRHLNFTYASGTSYLATGVSSDTGISLTYSYDSSGRLLQVTKPDQSKLNFEYDPDPYFYPSTPNPWITAVKDSNGKVLESHTYDCYGRGLTSARAGGVDAVTVTYSDSTYTGSCASGRFAVSQ